LIREVVLNVISVSSACDGDSSAQRYRDNFTLVRFSGFVVIILNCELVWKIFCYNNRFSIWLTSRTLSTTWRQWSTKLGPIIENLSHPEKALINQINW